MDNPDPEVMRSAPAAAFVLPPSLDLTGAEALHGTLRQQLHDGAILLDGRAVERIATPCLQVLAAAAASARAFGAPFRLSAASPALIAAITDLGLAAFIPAED